MSDPAPYNTFLRARCLSELGMSWDDAILFRQEEARAILADVLKHRWPHLREALR